MLIASPSLTRSRLCSFVLELTFVFPSQDYSSSLKQELLKDSSEDSLEEEEEGVEHASLLSPERLPAAGGLLSAG